MPTLSDPEQAEPLDAPSWRINPHHAFAAAAVCWTIFVVIVALALTGRSASFDAIGLQIWRTGPDLTPRGPGWLLEAVRDLTGMGGVMLRNLWAICAMVALLFLSMRREAVVFAGTVLGGWIVNSAIKHLVGRARPTIVPYLTEAGGYTFPSGHSFNSAVVFLGIALAFAPMTRQRSARWSIIGGAIALTWAISFSRVWLGVHFPSDVVAGWFGGAGWAFLAVAIFDRPARHALKENRTDS